VEVAVTAPPREDIAVRIKIVSDGTPKGTQVVDAATGEPVEHITGISWKVDANHLAEATLTLIKVPVEVESEAAIADRNTPS
jgi:hypothetical protein